MAKDYVKRGFTTWLVFLAVFLAVISFTSCGKDKVENKESKNEEVSGYVYKAEYKELGNVDVSDMSKACISKDGVYITAPYYVIDENYELKSAINYFMSCPSDSNKIDMTEIKDLKKNENIDSFLYDQDNNIVMLTSISHYDEYKNYLNDEYYLINIENSGNILKRIRLLPDLADGEQFNLGRSGVVYIDNELLVGSDSKIYTFNEDGSAGKTIEAESFITCMFADSNGKVWVLSYKDEKSGIFELDMETGKLGKAFNDNGNDIKSIDHVKMLNNGSVYLSNASGIFECNFENNKCGHLFGWIDVGVIDSSVVDFQPMEDGSIIVLCSETNWEEAASGVYSYDVELVTINKKNASEVKQKKKLKLAVNFIDDIVEKEILKFNRINEDYSIEVIKYGSYDDPYKQLNLDIISGNIPDIMEVSHMSKELYAKRGILADLYTFMENDNEIKKEDFVDTVRETMEYEGKLYYMPASFAVIAITGAKDVFGDAEGWTYDEMKEKYDNIQEDGMFMYGMSSENFIVNVIGKQLGDFINYDTGEVNLDSEEFVKLLEFSANFESGDEYNSSGWRAEGIDTYEMIKDNKLLLRSMSVLDFSDFQIDERIYETHGGYTILSYPSADKNNKLSMYSNSTGCYAITDKCSDKEGAWEFIKRLYGYEFQMSIAKQGWGFPVRKDALDKKIEYAMATEAYTDDDGTIVNPVDDKSSYYDDTLGDLDVRLNPYTEEQMERFRSVVDRIGISVDFDITTQDITDMIIEETKALYAGDKTAEETAGILQSRVKIYISENFN